MAGPRDKRPGASLVPANHATPAVVQVAGTSPAMLRWPEQRPIRLFRFRPNAALSGEASALLAGEPKANATISPARPPRP